ncbi:MAG TPA: MXAN_5187 C-terminal domain-containing protein [Sandaracinaceae bacterium LLY-WYZ-13_1]|nr:MXAN_5187 C-terminal domain-containing protein [Sandaracinaceae bacterium LLY-WYZ-13_1]
MDLKQFDVLLHDAEVKMKRLKALYEQWFQGIERIEPQVPRKELERLFKQLGKEKPRNTAARFRLQQLKARYNVYASYWQRIARQIEEGTYERDVRRARRRRGGMTAEPAPAETYELDVDVDVEDIDDEIADVLSVLDRRDTPAPAAPASPRKLSAFSPFAMRGSARSADGPAPRAPAAGSAAAATEASTRSDDATSPGTPNPFERGTGRQPVAQKERNPFERQPVTATFGKPRARPAEGAKADARKPEPRKPEPRKPEPPPPRSDGANAARPASPRRPPPPPPRRRAAAEGEAGMRRLYESYVAARRRNNQRTDNLEYEKMAQRVKKMESKLRAKHAGKRIDFEVVVQNGRVGLKPKIG